MAEWCDLGIGITKVPNEFPEDGNSSDGAFMFAGLTLGSGNYKDEIPDIIIPPCREKKMTEALTHGEQCALSSEFGKFIRMSRIARTDALYGASISARTFETAGAGGLKSRLILMHLPM